MISLLVLFGVLLLIATTIIDRKSQYDVDWMYAAGVCVTICSLVVLFVCGALYSNTMTIDDKITLYSDQNKEIEEQVASVVNSYMVYESDTFAEVKPETAFALAQTYPELISNNLVQQQISLYVTNNISIRTLKEEKLSYRVLAWWIYFGEQDRMIDLFAQIAKACDGNAN